VSESIELTPSESVPQTVTPEAAGGGEGKHGATPKKPGTAAAPPEVAAPAAHKACVCCAPNEVLPPKVVEAVKALEANLKMPVWLLVHGVPDHPLDALNEEIVWHFRQCRSLLPRNKPVALVIDSPGGVARCAYQLAKLLRGHCGSFVAVIPDIAKSAATLLALGAQRIIMAPYAELGPLDAQIQDAEREDYLSALDEVQALDRLYAFALQAADRAMFLLVQRTGRKTDVLLPECFAFATDFMRPLTEKIDAIHYTQMSRVLKVAELYAVRLLEDMYGEEDAVKIARALVQNYPEHGFVIDPGEAARIGLLTETPTAEQEGILEALRISLHGITAVGCLQEVTE
jgi:hypothetical protein